MIVYYAIGGGLGHRVRARRVLDALAVDARVVTNDDLPTDWPSLAADRLIVDAFPLGIQGELAGIDIPMDYVARLLRWDEYVASLGEVHWPHFETTYVVEELTREHDAWARAHSKRVVELQLNVDRVIAEPDAERYWLVVHSGPEDEVRELLAYAEELHALETSSAQILVATQCDIAPRIDAMPAHSYFANAERIISAAGFNVMLETEPFRDKHIVLPFPRRFDDQFTRAARRRLSSRA